MTMPPETHTSYRSSSDKDLIREQFDLPLLEQLHAAQGHLLCYFGLPGAEMLDIRSWRHLLSEVAAVDRDIVNLRAIDETVSMQMPELRFTPHHGEVDQVILRNRGWAWDRGSEWYRPWVSRYDQEHRRNGWYFDVVNLDYFGPFLPEQGRQRARQRADALRKLFDIERLDAWGQWVLLVTVEAQLLTPRLNTQLREYLRGVQDDTSEAAAAILKFLTQPVIGNQHVTATRLIHAAAASLITRAASQANLSAFPRGTILYSGSGGQHMVHLAYEFVPAGGVLPPPTPIIRLLRSPLLTTTTRSTGLELALLAEQPPNLSQSDVRTILDFLGNVRVERLVAQLS